MNPFTKQNYSKLALLALIIQSFFTYTMDLPQTKLPTSRQIDISKNLKSHCAEVIAEKLMQGTIDIAHLKSLCCPDLMDHIKEKLIYLNLLLFTDIFHALSFTALDYPERIDSVALSSDSRYALTAYQFRPAWLWNLHQKPATAIILPSNRQGITACAFSPDGNYALLGAITGTAFLCDLRNSPPTSIALKGHELRINAVAFSPDGRYAATASTDRTTRVWDLQQNPITSIVLKGHENGVRAVVFSKNGNYLLTRSVTECIARLYDLRQNPPAPYPLQHFNYISDIAFTPDEQAITSSDDSSIQLWKHPQLNACHGSILLRGHQGKVSSIALSPQGHLLLSGSVDKTIRLWNLQRGPITSISIPNAQPVVSVAMSPDSRHALFGFGSLLKTVRLCNLDAQTPTSIGLHTETTDVLFTIFSTDGKGALIGNCKQPKYWHFYREAEKLSIDQLLAIIGASKDPQKAAELQSACKTFETFALLENGKTPFLALKSGLLKANPLMVTLESLSAEHLKAICAYDFEQKKQ